MGYVLTLSHTLTVLAVQALFQSTIVIVVGLCACLVFRHRFPALGNALCRWTLVVLCLMPLMMFLVKQFHSVRYTVTLPLDTTILQGTPVADEPVRPTGIRQSPIQTDIQQVSLSPIQTVIDPVSADTSVPMRLDGNAGAGETPRRYTPVHTSSPDVSSHVAYAWIVYVILSVLWVILSVIGAVRLWNAYRRLRFILQAAIPAESELQQMVERQSAMMRVSPPLILRSPFVHSPFLTGIRYPIIMVPDYLTITDDMILHELMHLRRHDVVWSLMGQVLSIFIPLQVLLPYVISIMEYTNDLICDRWVVDQLRAPKKYATQLMSLAARLCPGFPKDHLGLGILPSGNTLCYRIKCILNNNPARVSPFCKILLVVGGLAVINSALLTGYIQVRGEVLPSLFARRFVFVNTLLYVPGTQPLFKVAESLFSHRTDADDVGKMSEPAVAESLPDRGQAAFTRNASHDARYFAELPRDNMSSETVGGIQAMPQDVFSGDGHGYTERTAQITSGFVASPVMDDDTLPDYQALAALHYNGASAPAAMSVALSGGAGIPGVPQAIARFSAAKQVNVTCEYTTLPEDPTDEELEEYLYYRSLDKYKQEIAWSPNGDLLAFTDNNRIWSVAISGGEPELVYEYKQDGYLVGAISDLCFTPDGKEIVFTKKIYDPALGSVITTSERYGGSTIINFANPIPKIESVNLETGELRVVVDEANMARLSHDGSCISYIRFDPAVYKSQQDENHGLPMVHDFITGRTVVLASEHMLYSRATFSPDDNHLVLACHRYGEPEQLYRANMTGKNLVPVTAYEDWAPHGRNIRNPMYDPTGRWILYTDATWQADGPDLSLWVYSTLTGAQYPLFDDCEYDQFGGVWNVDGSKYCFIRKIDDTNYLYVMDFVVPEQEKPVMDDSDRPVAFELKGNYPNPFNLQTTIAFSIPDPGHVSFVLYSISGQKVRTLVDDTLDAGLHEIVWDGCDDTGSTLASGTYLSLLSTDGHSARGKMTLLK